MKYLGIDYGCKRIGIAVSNQEGSIAFPRAVLPNGGTLLDAIKKILEDEHVEHIVIGDTRTHGGAENLITKEAEEFARRLAEATVVPVSHAFEVFSSIEASRYAPERSAHDDSAAAAVILQRYLDMHASR